MKIRNILYIILFLIGCTNQEPEFKAQAVGAATQFYIDTAGHANGACLFDSGVASPGTDRSKGANYHKNNTDLASTNGTTNPCIVTSAGSPFVADDAGNGIIITAGTNWTVQRALIVSVDGSGNATLDRACGSAATLSGGTWGLGRACSLNNSTAGISDDALFEMCVAGNIFNVKTGSYTLQAVAISAAGGTQNPCQLRGFTSVPGDTVARTALPVFDLGANNWSFGQSWKVTNMSFTSTGGNGVIGSNNGIIVNSKFTNTSTTANRNAVIPGSDSVFIGNEAISYRGNAINTSTNGSVIKNNYIHDSNIGITVGTAAVAVVIQGNLIINNVTSAINVTNTVVGGLGIFENTLFGTLAQRGTGLAVATGGRNIRLMNNSISGFTTGVNHADSQSIGFDDYNNYYNNGTDVTNWTKGANDRALNPSFGNVGEVTGSGATSASSTLTDGSKNFTTAGVVAGRDFLYVSSATGVTVGIYPITSVGTTTLDTGLSLGTGSNIVYSITTGKNFAVGVNLKNKGFPGAISPYTNGYQDIGAVQRKEGFPRGR